MKKFLTALGVFLTGCSSPQSLIQPPDVEEIYSYVGKLEYLSGAKIVDGADLVTAAYYVVDDRCQKFFDQLEANKARLLFAQSTTTDATSLAVQVLTQLTVAQRDIGIVAASGKFLSDTIKNYNTIYYFAPYSGQLHKLVGEAQTNYKTSLIAAVKNLDGQPLSNAKVFFTAANMAQGYGRTCTYSQFQLFVETALGKAKAKQSTDASADSLGSGEASDSPTLLERGKPSNQVDQVYIPPYVSD